MQFIAYSNLSKMKKTIFYLTLFLCAQIAFGQNHLMLQDTIKNYFAEIKMATKNENKIWDRDLFGPILLVNSNTRQLYSNYPDSAGILKKDGNIYYGNLPEHINIANTSINWSGRRWAMIMLPLPAEKFNRINLMAHELFHKAQPSLGFQLFNTDNNHLDQKDGRVYLRLELEALKKAVNATGQAEMKLYLTDALTFRKYRYSIYPGADTTENALELNEGLAEYTGFIISRRSKEESILHFNQSLTEFLSNPTFVRSFAYQTIPVYGYLLHYTKKYWNKNITVQTNLADYFTKAFNVTLKSDLKKSADNSVLKYNGQKIIDEETAREAKIKKLVAQYKNKFIEQPHFEIQFEQMNVSFDPRNIMPVEDKGTVYPNIRVSDKWGILTVTNGALMSPNWDKISISVPTKNDGKNFIGDGWTLIINDGYTLIKEESNGNYKMVKK